MCGRFYVDDETAREIERLTKEVDERIHRESKKTDIHPTETAVVLAAKEHAVAGKRMRWGYPGIKDAKLMINARAESVLEKKMFQQDVISRRIIIPAAGFYEWNTKKEKVVFSPKEGSTFYMAGFYGYMEGEQRFVILTTQANDSVREVHHRMPLLLEREEIMPWLLEKEQMNQLLKKTPKPINKSMEYEQQCLPF